MTPEREIQTRAVRLGRELGWTILVSSDRRATASTRGTPDVWVHVFGALWAGVEFKSPIGRVRKEQQEMADDHMVALVRSVDEFLDALKVLEQFQLILDRNFEPTLEKR